jgi:hypothetical protein
MDNLLAVLVSLRVFAHFDDRHPAKPFITRPIGLQDVEPIYTHGELNSGCNDGKRVNREGIFCDETEFLSVPLFRKQGYDVSLHYLLTTCLPAFYVTGVEL